MPVILRVGPYRFFFYSNENVEAGEPPHVHVSSADGWAVIWLSPVRVRRSGGYTPTEISRVLRVVASHRTELLRRWNEFFGRGPTL